MNRPHVNRRTGRRRIALAIRTRAGGYTLLEGLIASVLLAVSAVGVAGAMSASYAHDQHVANRCTANQAGRQLIDEVASLPMTSASGPSMADYANYSDSASNANTASVLASRDTASTGTTTASRMDGDDDDDDDADDDQRSGGLLGGIITSVTNIVGGLLGGGSGSGSGSSNSGTGGASAGGGSTPAPVSITSKARVTKVDRSLAITRRSTINGPADANGDFAVIRMTIRDADGKSTTHSRLISSAEAEANR